VNEPGNGFVPDGPGPEEPGWPWSFILLVVAGGLYLVFRFVELAVKLFR